ncbi:DEAD/DEAH box helicase family protein [Nocardia higoensis]|uniref:DEAD/DEAH box helicase family protein n=1 Tax=Nocardia higoensis TaxID=228599 RepID=A0ABS0DG43_9NOCA|nr:DEAD/DEAH box helicase family protein [Nocardia higoensis]MBF6357406.1 DEAD/DEAH box helicase family protein [Nocardia higoensis]
MPIIDSRLLDAARKSVNFGSLAAIEPLLTIYGAGAESSVYTDPNGALIKCRQFGEVLAEQLIRRSGTRFNGSKQIERIQTLERAGVLTRFAADALHDIRRTGNEATHSHLFNVRAALRTVEQCWQLGDLLRLALSPDDQKPCSFIAPQPPAPPQVVEADDQAQLDEINARLAASQTKLTETLTVLDAATTVQAAEADARRAAEQELANARQREQEVAARLAALEKQLAALQDSGALASAEPAKVSAASGSSFSKAFRRRPPLNEVQARRAIDAQLVATGWVVQDYVDVNPAAGVGVAVREFRLATGYADYVLYVDSKIVGVIEAKREGTALIGVEHQTAKYARGLRKSDQLAAWRQDEPLPFCYESTGVETRFTNRLDPRPRSREVFTFARPQTIRAWMHQAAARPEAPTFRARLQHLPPLDPKGLRPNQIQAINGIERSLATSRPRGLVQMATGAGKTFTAVTASYRLIKHADASKILFLVDRNNLGEQAQSEFDNYVPIDDGRRFGDIYNVQRLAGRVVLGSTNVAISTIQRLFLLLQGKDLPDADVDDDVDGDTSEPEAPVDAVYNPNVPPETFDLIIVDECHRSIYGRWRAVLDYFDAPIIGLTATPTKQTLGFFDQNLVSEYTYEESVIDGVNVPFDVYRIRTAITESGATIEAKTVVPVRDRRTRAQRYLELDDDFSYTGEAIGRDVIAEDQIRSVLATFRDRLYTEIFPGRWAVPKTLIFAKTDAHADVIVEQVREVFDEGADFAAKITYKSKGEGRDPKRLLQDFRNSPSLRIAVTVDMIATGTDVRAIECVLFLRAVRSAVYFEQMKGRGSRIIGADDYAALTPDVAKGRTKDRFVIIDAVGVTESPLVDATPMERVPSVSLKKLLQKAGALTITPDEASSLAVRLAKLASQLDPVESAELAEAADGIGLREIVKRIAAASDTDAVLAAEQRGGQTEVAEQLHKGLAPLSGNPGLRQAILDIRRKKDLIFDQVNADTLLGTERIAYGGGTHEPIRSFREYLAEHRDEITVLQVLHGSAPGRPTYAELEALAEQVARVPAIGSIETLWRAYADLGELADPEHRVEVPDLVSILRFELAKDVGAPDHLKIQPFASLVEDRLAAWLAEQQRRGVEFTDRQHRWLGTIVDVVKTNMVVEVADLDRIPFSDLGGSQRFAADFEITSREAALQLLDELNTELIA